MDNGDIEGGDEEFHAPRGREYRPVVANDSAIFQMSSMDPGSPSVPSLKYKHLSLFQYIYVYIYVFVFVFVSLFPYIYWIWKWEAVLDVEF